MRARRSDTPASPPRNSSAADRRGWVCRRSCCCRSRRGSARRLSPPPCRSHNERRRLPLPPGSEADWRSRGDRAGLVVTQVFRDRPQGGVDALAFLVFLQRGHDIAPALTNHIRNAGSGTPAVETVTALALLVRQDLACANVRRSLLLGRAFVRAADQRYRQEHGEQQVFHGRLRPLLRWHFSRYSVFTPRTGDE